MKYDDQQQLFLQETAWLLERHGALLGVEPSDAEAIMHDFRWDHVLVSESLLAFERARLHTNLMRDVTLGFRRPSVGFFAPTAAYSKPLQLLAEAYHAEGGIARLLSGHISNRAFVSHPLGSYCGRDAVRKLEGFDVIVTTTLSDGLPSTPIKVLVMHDIIDSPLGNTHEFCRLASYYDAILVGSKPAMEMLTQLFQERPPERPLTLIPSGYLRLDENIAAIASASPCKLDRIVYAPTVLATQDWMPFCTAYALAPKIIEALLNATRDELIVFRPHPNSLEHPAVKSAVDQVAKWDRVVIDDDGSDYMFHYARAKLLVTDISGTAYTYAFSTLRPVLFVSPAEDRFIAYGQGEFYRKNRNVVGKVVSSTDAIPATIRDLLAARAQYAEATAKLRQETIYNIGHAKAHVIDAVTKLSRRHGSSTFVTLLGNRAQMDEGVTNPLVDGNREEQVAVSDRHDAALAAEALLKRVSGLRQKGTCLPLGRMKKGLRQQLASFSRGERY